MSYLGESIPKLGFGLMRLPRLEDGETIDIEQVKQMVDAFLEAGGTYFDTARAYGESENAIRQALVERYPRESFQLATKNAAWIGPKSYEDARKDFDISIENTGAGYFDFYLIHNTGGARTKVFDDLEMWDFVKQLKADGKVKHIGFSHHDSAAVLEEVIAPDGYNKLTYKVKLEVSNKSAVISAVTDPSTTINIADETADNKLLYTFTVHNSNGVELPNSGGPGTLIYTLGGLMLILASAMMYGFRLRRGERRIK